MQGNKTANWEQNISALVIPVGYYRPPGLTKGKASIAATGPETVSQVRSVKQTGASSFLLPIVLLAIQANIKVYEINFTNVTLKNVINTIIKLKDTTTILVYCEVIKFAQTKIFLA